MRNKSSLSMMVPVRTVAEGVHLSFDCPKCGQKTEQTVSWLIDKDILACRRCGYGIDLKRPDARRRIEETASTAARVQAALTEAGDLS